MTSEIARLTAERDLERERAAVLVVAVNRIHKLLESDFGGFYLSAQTDEPLGQIRDMIEGLREMCTGPVVAARERAEKAEAERDEACARLDAERALADRLSEALRDAHCVVDGVAIRDALAAHAEARR